MRELGHLIVGALIQIGQVFLDDLVATLPLGLARVYVSRLGALPHRLDVTERTLGHVGELLVIDADAREHGPFGLVERVHERVDVGAVHFGDAIGRADLGIGEWALAKRRLVKHLDQQWLRVRTAV